LLISTSKDEGNGRIGAAMAGHEVEWGLEKVGEYGPIYLYRIR
jgi:hypothetical protein